MYEIHTVESAPAGSKAALESVQERVGFVPNLAAMMAGSPVLVDGFIHLQGALASTTLTGAEREVIGLTVSFANNSSYSMAAHSTFGLRQGLPQDVVTALRGGLPLPDARLQVLHEFVLAVVNQRGHANTDALEAADFTNEQVFEIVAQIGYTSMANWAANLGDSPVDDAFKPQYWSSAIL